MSKVKLKKQTGKSKTNERSKTTYNRKSYKGDTWFFATEPAKKKETQKPKSANPFIMPPTDGQDYSCNWRKLLQTLPPNPEKKNEGTGQIKDANVNGKRKPSSSKDSHKPEKHFRKAKETVKAESEKSKRVEKDGELTNGKEQSGHKQFKAEKRKNKDGKEKGMNKKSKAEEEEKKTAEPDLWFDDVDPDDIESALGTEAADIMRKRCGLAKCDPKNTEKMLVKEHAFEGVTRAVAMDCEMVGVGYKGEDSILARVSLVNHFGKCIYDKYVKPTEKVTDYRTAVSGIRPDDIKNGEDIKTVQKEVAQILKGRILVGHAIHNDLKILLLDHPKKMIRDTQRYKPFRQKVKSSRPALRNLCRQILNVQVQQGEHSSVQDAQATMRLYTMVRKQWEAELKAMRGGTFKKSPRKPKPAKNQKK